MRRTVVTYIGVSVDEAIDVEDRKDVPVVALSQLSDVRVVAGEEFVEDIGNGSWGNPFAGVNSTFDENARIVFLEGQLDSLDLTTLVALAADHDLNFVGVRLGEVVQVRVDLLQRVVARPAEAGLAYSARHRVFIIDEFLNVLDEVLVIDTRCSHQIIELLDLSRPDHQVDGLVHVTRTFPERILEIKNKIKK